MFRFLIVGLSLISFSSFAENIFSYDTEQSHLQIYFNRLQAVSCDNTATQCLAIGFGVNSQMHDRLVYKTEDGGKTWDAAKLLTSPAEEKEQLSDDPNPASIFCNKAGVNCYITSSAIINKVPTPILYTTTDGGESWSEPQIIPLPTKVNVDAIYSNDSIRTKISCDDSGTKCVVAGGIIQSNEQYPLLYTTRDAGKTWNSVENLKKPWYQSPFYYIHGSYLNSVNCNYSGSSCLVVGDSIITESVFSYFYAAKPISYTSMDENMTAWGSPKIASPEVNSDFPSSFLDIACDGTGIRCLGIGYYNQNGEVYSFVTSTQDSGLNWEKGKPLESPAAMLLNAVSCDDSGSNCTAVGLEHNFDSTLWSLKPVVYTSTTGKDLIKNTSIPLPLSATLNDVFCSDTGNNCIAVGIRAGANQLMNMTQKKLNAVSFRVNQK